MGYTTVELAKVTEAELLPVLRESHALASEPAKRRPSPKTTKAKATNTETAKRTGSAATPRAKRPAKRSG